MQSRLKVVQYGVGSIGCEILKLALEKKCFDIVGVIDLVNVGKDLGDLLGSEKLGIRVSDDPNNVISLNKPDIVLHSTSSFLLDILPQLNICIKNGADVISTCEELVYPFWKYPDLSAKLNFLAKEHQSTVLGTGINPGFLMDALPISLMTVCQTVNKVKIIRQMDAGKRRSQFQKKIGAGLNTAEFKRKISEKSISGHVGLTESIAMISKSLGWKLSDIREGIPTPIIAQEYYSSKYVKVNPAQVAGLQQEAIGYIGNTEVINLDFKASLCVKEEFDRIIINGIPPVQQTISPCINGDLGTAAMIVNNIFKVAQSEPGLITMRDISLQGCIIGNNN